jgi:hypothetical protein
MQSKTTFSSREVTDPSLFTFALHGHVTAVSPPPETARERRSSCGPVTSTAGSLAYGPVLCRGSGPSAASGTANANKNATEIADLPSSLVRNDRFMTQLLPIVITWSAIP